MTSFWLLIVSISVDIHSFVAIFSSSFSNKHSNVISVACVAAVALPLSGWSFSKRSTLNNFIIMDIS